MHEHRVEKVLVVNNEFQLKGMITLKDYQKAESKPNACKDEFGRLRVGRQWEPVRAMKNELML